MTKTFERFLRSFSDEELVAFAGERSRLQPPYWRALMLALRIEAGRRGLHLENELPPPTPATGTPTATRTGTA
jgi:hypothetical protein